MEGAHCLSHEGLRRDIVIIGAISGKQVFQHKRQGRRAAFAVSGQTGQR